MSKIFSIILLFYCIFLNYTNAFSQTSYSVKHFTMEDGLLANNNLNVCGDKQGFFWFGSEKGLQQFDGYVFRSFPISNSNLPRTIQYKIFDQQPVGDNGMLFASSIGLLFYSYKTALLSWIPIEDDSELYETIRICPIDSNLYLIGTRVLKKLLVYNCKSNTVKYVSGKLGSFFNNTNISGIFKGLGTSILIARDREYYEIDFFKQTIKRYYQDTLPRSILINRTFLDEQKLLWLATDRGVYIQRPDKMIERLTSIDTYCELKDQICTDIAPCTDSTIYLSFDWQGVILINTRTKKIISKLRHEKNSSVGFASNAVYKLYSDNQHWFWACGNEGAYLVIPDNSGIKFHDGNSKTGLQSSAISKILEDSHGTIWVATDGGGLHSFSLTTGQFTSFWHENAMSNAPGSNMIVDLYEERSGENLWIGTFNGGLSCFNYSNKRFTNFYQNSSNDGIMKNTTWCITEDQQNRLLVSSYCESISILDRRTNKWTNATIENGGIKCECISVLFTDKNGKVWTGSAGCGLGLFENNDTTNISTVDILNYLLEDGNYLWVGMNSGLHKFDKKILKYIDFKGQSFFTNKKINCIFQDSSQQLWIAAENTLYVYDKKTGKAKYSDFNQYFKGYDITCITKTRDGHLFIGGRNGLLVVPPQAINTRETPQFTVSLTEMRLFREAVQPGRDAVIHTHCNFLQTIVLPYYQNYVGFSFSTLNTILSNDVGYSCKLDGLDKKWIMIDAGKNSIEYSNLQPGNYTLHIRATSKYNPLLSSEKIVNLQIQPPLWKTWWFRILISIVVSVSLLMIYLFRIRQLKKQQLELEIAVIQRTSMIVSQKEELATQAETLEDQYLSLKEKQTELEHVVAELQLSNSTKNKFFSIVAHDLKSPFSGISGIIQILFERFDSYSNERKKELLEGALLSVQSIQSLIDNLLQWSQSQSNSIIIQPVPINLGKIITNSCSPLEAAMNNKKISLQKQIPDSLLVYADYNTLSTVIRNLVQNAIKFCPHYGSIRISASRIENDILIDFEDTGIGMEQSVIDRLLHSSQEITINFGTSGEIGTGLGLELCNEFIKKNNGKLFITSEKDVGTKISVVIPVVNNNEVDLPDIHQNIQEEEASVAIETIDLSVLKENILLIVEDNPLIRDHIKSVISQHMKIVEANNGQIGFERALEHIPDIIISDVAMPVMDGFEMCRKINSTPETQHIPVILLTAKTSPASRLEGLSNGAIDYLTKPFNEQELLMKLYNILNNRRKQQQRLQSHFKVFLTKNISEFSSDPIITKMFMIIDENVADPEFNVDYLCSILLISRSTLFRKTKSALNKSPNDLIIEYRLRKAMEMLITREYRVSEVAYQVGFNDPKYFSRVFKEMFGCAPSEALNNNNGE